MPRNPLRRLSVALKLSEAYVPAQTPTTPTASSSLSHFLSTSKAKYLKDVQESPAKGAAWIVVMGNEAGDLDSIASSIAYAWIQTVVNKKQAIPLIQVERADLVLRAENLYALGLAGISESQEELLTLTELKGIHPFPSHQFALVDHNRLGPAYSLDNPLAHVTAIVDHHEDEGVHLDASPRIIGPCGSCASHVGALCPPELPAELATLLLTAIVIDTDGLKPGGKATQTDRDSALFLAPKSTFANRIPPLSALAPIDRPNPDALYDAQAVKDLNGALQSKKSDVSHLSALDLLRRDYKEYTYTLSWAAGRPSVKAGLCTVPVRLKEWALQGRLEAAAVEWMTKRNVTVLGVLTSFRDAKGKEGKSGKGKHKREMAWIILEEPELSKLPPPGEGERLTTEVLAKRLWTSLEQEKELDLKKYKKIDLEKGKLLKGSKAKVYKQGNAGATRKTTAPILKNILEGQSSTEGPQDGPSK